MYLSLVSRNFMAKLLNFRRDLFASHTNDLDLGSLPPFLDRLAVKY